MEIQILQTAYTDPMGVTQPEINRIVQTLHRAAPAGSSTSLAAESK